MLDLVLDTKASPQLLSFITIEENMLNILTARLANWAHSLTRV
jgi:hypothetical protein